MMFRSAFAVVVILLMGATDCLGQTIKLSRFDIDVTPPVGFPMAYERVIRVEELGLRCRGIVLQGSGDPIVVCAVDWIGIGNEAHDAFRDTIAKAVGTTRQRVAVQTLHQHDAPRCDLTAERLLNQAGATDLGALEGSFAREVLKRLAVAAKASLVSATPVTHAAISEANVDKVASNRRIQDETGKVIQTRFTTCRNPKLRALPDGIIDPVLTTVSFFHNDKPLAVLSYYACHPQSYYRTGVPSPDFPGIARFMRGQDMPDVLHVHFNGAGGNIGAGKYNDGAKENRMILASRVADAMKRSFESAKKFTLQTEHLQWHSTPVALPLGKHIVAAELREKLKTWKPADYWGSPEQLAWALRCESGHKIDLSCLKVGDARILHMPGELFVEYQLAAKKLRPNLNVAMAAYGDYGPGYIGTEASYGQGGYETSAAASKVDPGVEKILMDGVKKLLDVADSTVGDFAAELPRIPPTEPADTLKSFHVAEGYKIELVAAEPLIGSPVAVQWDADGRMYVCEMRGYSENQDDTISTIGLLTDSDNDGVYDSRIQFAEGLRWPTAIFPFDGGLFVGDAPHVYYMKDTDGDGKADIKKTVLTGFGTSNVQGLMNSMRWDLDSVIHLACSSAGGKIQIAGSDDNPINVRGRDIVFDPRSYQFKPTSGAAQHGMCFDDWGHKFVSSNSNHIMQVMYEDHHVANNPYLNAPSARVSIAADGPQAEVFRTSPVEPWRIVRTRLRVAGTVKGAIEGGGRAAGYFTGATGVTIYRGDAWPKQHKGLAIVGDVGSNLIHRKKLSNVASHFIAQRIDDKSEFVTSDDVWFRPCQFANAPDGSLHVIDFCREVIEHPKSLPPDIKKHLDLNAGRDRGRIYRIVPVGYQYRATPKLSKASASELATLLEHPNAWHRETAARLLYERQEKSVVDALKQLVTESTSPLARMHSLYVLQSLEALSADVLKGAFVDEHPQVRRHAIRLADRTSLANELADDLITLASHPNSAVRQQLAFALAKVDYPGRDKALAQIITNDDANRWTQVAVQSALGRSAANVFGELIADSTFRSPSASEFLSKLAAQIGQQNEVADIQKTAASLSALPEREAEFALPIIGKFLDGRNDKKSVLAKLSRVGQLDSLDQVVAKMVDEAAVVMIDRQRDSGARIAAIRSLQYGQFQSVGNFLADRIDSSESQDIQLAALSTLSGFDDPDVATIILDAWRGLSPRMRSAASEILYSRPNRTLAFFDAVDAKSIPNSDLNTARLKQLAKSKHKLVAKRAKGFLQSASLKRRSDVVKLYQESLQMPADAKRGLDVFKKSCAACHKVNGIGHELGPSLAGIKTRGAETILVNVLDPNREVNPQYLNYVVLSSSGRTMTGMITAENANTITLRRGEGAQDIIQRGDIDQMRSSGASIMPNEMEKQISKQNMADLIAYLMNL